MSTDLNNLDIIGRITEGLKAYGIHLSPNLAYQQQSNHTLRRESIPSSSVRDQTATNESTDTKTTTEAATDPCTSNSTTQLSDEPPKDIKLVYPKIIEFIGDNTPINSLEARKKIDEIFTQIIKLKLKNTIHQR
jgi:hypothetical protein